MRFLSVIAWMLLVGCKTASAPVSDPVSPAVAECRCEDGCPDACPVDDTARTSYRKIVRDPSPRTTDTEPADAFSVLDVQAGDPLTQSEIDAAAAALNRSANEIVGGFRGDFVRGRGTELAVLTAAGELVVFKDGAVFASVALGTPAPSDALVAVKLVDDRLEAVVRHTEEGREMLTVCRVIGRAIGRVFDSEADSRTVEFVHLGDERAIRVRGRDGKSTVFRWNPWEGMFRVPAVAPTAPPAS